MTEATCNRMSVPFGNKPPVSQDHSATHTGVPPAASSNVRPQNNAPSSELPRQRDDVSRLSEGLEPMHIDDRIPQEHDLQDGAGEAGRLGVHVKDAMATIQQLDLLGMQNMKIPLPKIIVLGEQSTGKSSVIESISGIKTPRSTGTCTRCPLFIQLEPLTDPAAKWTACVTLRRSYIYDGKSGRNSERRYPGWVQQTKPEIFNFAATGDPRDLEELIHRAQQATTSPWTDPKDFLDPSKDHIPPTVKCNFSPNVVCISIMQQGVPPLSFYDLPGIVGQAEDPKEVKFVKDLVSEYVRDQEALILVTSAMDNDIANSTAGGIARTLKAADRCIGVLTKPDRITVEASQEKIQEVFIDKRLSFGHGYFVVRNLDQKQLDAGITHQGARLQEEHFFETIEPWAGASPDVRTRLGTVKLQSYLSCKLAEQIINRLPTIREKIDARLRDVEEQLQQYPAPPKHNAFRIILEVITEFSYEVRNEIVADYPCTDWRNTWEELQKDLFDGLASLKPTMVTGARQDKGVYIASLASTVGATPGGSPNDAIALDDSGDENDRDRDTRMSGTPNPETPTKKRKLETTPAPSPVKNQRSTNRNPNRDFSEQRTKYHLDEVEQHLKTRSKARVPGQIESRVLNTMMIDSLQKWELALEGFFDSLEKRLRSQIKVMFDKSFKKWQGTALYASAWKIVEEMLVLNVHQQRNTMAVESLDDEKAGPYIFHSDLYNRDKEIVLQAYRQARFKARYNMYKKERQQRTGKEMTPAEEVRVRKDGKAMAVLNAEPYAVELDTVAKIVTYYMMAARRFHDSICMRIESQFFKQLRTQLMDELGNGLGINDENEGHSNAVSLLAEQSQRERERQVLVAQITSLRQAQQVLINLEKKKYGGEENATHAFGFGSASDSGESFGIPTPQPDEMEEM